MSAIIELPLKDISRPKQWPTLSRRELKSEGYPVYGANGRIGFAATYTHDEPTIIIGCRGSCGTLHITEPKSYVTGNAMALDNLDTERVDQKYLFHFLAKRGFEDVVSGSSQPQITGKGLTRVKVPLPKIDEQRRIAAILDKADAIRRKREQALALANDLLKSTFLEMFGDPAINPFGFEKMPISKLAEKISDGPFGSNLKSAHYVPSGVRVVRLQNIGVDEFVARDEAFISEDHFSSLNRHECRPGDLLVGTLGDPNLRACIQPDWLDVALNKADCVQLRVDEEIATREFLCVLLNRPSTEDLAKGLVLGQTRSRISMGRLRTLEVPVPPLDRQKEFSLLYRKQKRSRRTMVAALEASEKLFASLSQRAFRGEL